MRIGGFVDIKEKYYYYYQRDESVSHTNGKHTLDTYLSYDEMLLFLKKHNLYKPFYVVLQKYLYDVSSFYEELFAANDKELLGEVSVYFNAMLTKYLNYQGDSEKDLENAILSQVEEFLSELGSDFTFVKRQKRITVDAVDYYIDLIFFHRELRRLVAIDLKLGKFKPEHEGQMRLYLRYLNQNDRKPWEESPIGLILCSEGNTEHVEYLMLDEESPIKVAQYYTKLPDKKLLSEKLRKAIAIAREHYNERKGDEA